jgi:hypothetical protein
LAGALRFAVVFLAALRLAGALRLAAALRVLFFAGGTVTTFLGLSFGRTPDASPRRLPQLTAGVKTAPAVNFKPLVAAISKASAVRVSQPVKAVRWVRKLSPKPGSETISRRATAALLYCITCIETHLCTKVKHFLRATRRARPFARRDASESARTRASC